MLDVCGREVLLRLSPSLTRRCAFLDENPHENSHVVGNGHERSGEAVVGLAPTGPFSCGLHIGEARVFDGFFTDST